MPPTSVDDHLSVIVDDRRWIGFFGVSPKVTSIVWKKITESFFKSKQRPQNNPLNGAEPQHLLWAFAYLKIYAEDSVLASLVGGTGRGKDEKTYRKWRDIFVLHISYLISEVVS